MKCLGRKKQIIQCTTNFFVPCLTPKLIMKSKIFTILLNLTMFTQSLVVYFFGLQKSFDLFSSPLLLIDLIAVMNDQKKSLTRTESIQCCKNFVNTILRTKNQLHRRNNIMNKNLLISRQKLILS